MNPKKITTLINASIASLLMSLPFARVLAEEPVDSAWLNRFENAEWVALARIESVQSLINPALSSESGMMAVQGYSYALTVLQSLKSDQSEITKLRVDLSDCPLLLALDNDYVIFASRNYRGQLQIQSCDHVLHAQDAAPVISFIQQQQTIHQTEDNQLQ